MENTKPALIALRIAGALCLFSGAYYMTAELIAVLFSAERGSAYFLHTVSELGVPLMTTPLGVEFGFSPLFRLMNNAFILAGAIYVPCYPVCFWGLEKRWQKVVLVLLSLFTGLGVIIVGIFHGDNPAVLGIHGAGAAFTFVAGNALSLFTGLCYKRKDFNAYAIAAICLGATGLAGAFLTLFFELSALYTYAGFVERLTIYPIVIWQILGGIYALTREEVRHKSAQKKRR